MEEIGLVFSGGGGKGAYQIGVWKYLRELGIERYIRVVSGTSVGGLNAALFLGSDYETAERMWLNIRKDKILTPRKISLQDVVRWISEIDVGPLYDWKRRTTPLSLMRFVMPSKILLLLRHKLENDYIFSRQGIKDMIKEGIDFSILRSPATSCYVTCFSCDRLKAKRFRLNDYSPDEITTLLLATSAIPIVFPSEEFRGEKYYDGGVPIFGDNVPVKPVYDAGVRNIIVVHLSRDDRVDKSKFPNARIIEIVPSEDLGNLKSGTLDFSSEGALHRWVLGYEDAKNMIGPIERVEKTFGII